MRFLDSMPRVLLDAQLAVIAWVVQVFGGLVCVPFALEGFVVIAGNHRNVSSWEICHRVGEGVLSLALGGVGCLFEIWCIWDSVVSQAFMCTVAEEILRGVLYLLLGFFAMGGSIADTGQGWMQFGEATGVMSCLVAMTNFILAGLVASRRPEVVFSKPSPSASASPARRRSADVERGCGWDKIGERRGAAASRIGRPGCKDVVPRDASPADFESSFRKQARGAGDKHAVTDAPPASAHAGLSTAARKLPEEKKRFGDGADTLSHKAIDAIMRQPTLTDGDAQPSRGRAFDLDPSGQRRASDFDLSSQLRGVVPNRFPLAGCDGGSCDFGPEYECFRRQATEASERYSTAAAAATAAYAGGNGWEAHKQLEEKKRFKNEMDTLNKRAVEVVMRPQMMNGKDYRSAQLHLHGLFVHEAEEQAKTFLEYWRASTSRLRQPGFSQAKDKATVVIITGVGQHPKDQQSRVQSRIKHMLKSMGLKYEMQQSNGAMLINLA